MELIYEMFFKRPRMRGRRDSSFFDKINGSFVCLMAVTIQHCLKEWKEGQIGARDFKYETAADE